MKTCVHAQCRVAACYAFSCSLSDTRTFCTLISHLHFVFCFISFIELELFSWVTEVTLGLYRKAAGTDQECVLAVTGIMGSGFSYRIFE